MNTNKEKVALVLSGGGSRGAYEAGAWQALTDLGIDIDIVTGTSVGAINGALVCQGSLEIAINLWKELETHMIFDVPEGSQTIDYAKEFVLNKGAGATGLKELLNNYIDEDKLRASSIEYGLVVVERSSLKPRFLYKEDIDKGKLIDYILASASIYPAVQPCEIDGNEYIDGGYADVLPIEMAAKKGATHIIAVKLNAPGLLHHDTLKDAPNLTLIEPKFNLGNVLVFDTKNSLRIMRLGYLDTMKSFNLFDGGYYTFAKDSFNKTDTKMADAAAHIFGLDPTIIYTKEQFLKKLSHTTQTFEENLDDTVSSLKKNGIKPATIINFLKGVKSVADTRILCLIIAESLKEKGIESIFIKRNIAKLVPEQLLAARFILKYDLM